MEDTTEEWQVGSPAWQRQQEELAIANIGTVFEDPPPKEPAATKPQKPGTFYIWRKEDNWPSVAQRTGFSRQDLIDHNDIEDPHHMEAGYNLHLPVSLNYQEPESRKPVFEVLPEPLPMHVKKPGGCKKWSFGNMNTWEDAKSAGFFPPDTNLTIVAVAHVPIVEKDGKEADAAYYMDSNALGDYRTTGSVRWTVGYMWSDLAEGHVDKQAKPAPPVAQKAMKEQKAKEIAKKSVDIAATNPAKHYLDGFDQSFIEKRLADTLRDGDAHRFKRSYQPLTPPIPCTASIPDDVGDIDAKTGRRFVLIHDFDTKRPDRKLFDLQEVTVAGTFDYEGVTLGRPEKSAENFNWYGIDMNLLQSDAELYNAKLDATTRAEQGRTLTWSERFVWVPASKLLNHPVFENRRQKKQKTKQGK